MSKDIEDKVDKTKASVITEQDILLKFKMEYGVDGRYYRDNAMRYNPDSEITINRDYYDWLIAKAIALEEFEQSMIVTFKKAKERFCITLEKLKDE